MSPSPLLIVEKIRKAGGSIWGEQNNLRIVNVSIGLLTPEDKQVLAEFKSQLIPVLSRPVSDEETAEREAIIWTETAPAEELDQALAQAITEFDQIVQADRPVVIQEAAREELETILAGPDQEIEFIPDLDEWLDTNTIDPVICDGCGSLDRWQDLVGGWHCTRCDPPLRAQMLRLQAARLRRLTHERVLTPIPEQDLPRPLVGTGHLEEPCPYCGGGLYCDALIHRGRSVRRDCRDCGRFLVFVRWNGN